VFILEHYVSSKSFTALREAVSTEIRNKNNSPAGNNISGHRKYL
jgi:hypothetical protein